MECAPRSDEMEAVTTSAPERCSTICEPKACRVRSTPVVLTASTRCQVASSSSRTGTLQPMPAFAQAMSTRPCASSTAASAASRLCARGDVVAHGAGVVALAAQLGAHALGAARIEIARNHARALLAELARDRGADRPTGAGDVRNLPVEQHRRARLPA